ncbi:TSUP family transporter [Streptomyces sp. Marseille-Q5077]|uniref:TSUP family transporter n=1 Tax=Streptomyces sp. Marseille-Q5077 TaxID=3418995 RepID=UPI003D0663CE
MFGFAALSAVILNKAMSLVVVLVALPARLAAVPASELGAHWTIAANLLAGSPLGAWAGATWAVRMPSSTLYKVLAALIVLMAAALLRWPGHRPAWSGRGLTRQALHPRQPDPGHHTEREPHAYGRHHEGKRPRKRRRPRDDTRRHPCAATSVQARSSD